MKIEIRDLYKNQYRESKIEMLRNIIGMWDKNWISNVCVIVISGETNRKCIYLNIFPECEKGFSFLLQVTDLHER